MTWQPKIAQSMFGKKALFLTLGFFNFLLTISMRLPAIINPEVYEETDSIVPSYFLGFVAVFLAWGCIVMYIWI